MDNVIYCFHPVTREFIGAALADESPLEPEVLLLPANSTRNAPPATALHTVAVFDPEAADWHVLPDYRGATLYSTADGLPVTVADIGPQPEGTTDQPRPSSDYSWSDDSWTFDAQAAAARVWELIKAERDRRKSLGFLCAGNWYHSDGESKTQHLGNKDTARDQLATGALPADPLRDPITNQVIVWKTMAGQFVPLTCQLAIDIVAAGKSLEFQVFAAAEMHRAQMAASPDPAAYDFSGGWPPVFGE